MKRSKPRSVKRRSKPRSVKRRSKPRSVKRSSGEKTKNIKMYRNNILLPKSSITWISSSKGYVYISYPSGRSYWILSKIDKKPRMSFNENTNTFRISTFKIKFDKSNDFKKIYNNLAPYS